MLVAMTAMGVLAFCRHFLRIPGRRSAESGEAGAPRPELGTGWPAPESNSPE